MRVVGADRARLPAQRRHRRRRPRSRRANTARRVERRRGRRQHRPRRRCLARASRCATPLASSTRPRRTSRGAAPCGLPPGRRGRRRGSAEASGPGSRLRRRSAATSPGCDSASSATARIARKVAERAIGVRDGGPPPRPARHWAAGLVRDLDALLGSSDAVSLHVPLTDETRHLLDARRLGLLPEGAIVDQHGAGTGRRRGGLLRRSKPVASAARASTSSTTSRT